MCEIATTIEQAERLLACGVPAETADMSRQMGGCIDLMDYCFGVNERKMRRGDYDVTPAWSLSALLEKVLPKWLDKFELKKMIKDDVRTIDEQTIIEGPISLQYEALEPNWYVEYGFNYELLRLTEGGSPIEAVVQAVELLHLNGYKFN